MQDYIIVCDFMLKDLKLKENELLIYATIYGFSKDDESFFYGSYDYLANLLNINRSTAIRCVNSLCDKGLLVKIAKNVNGKQRNFYTTSKNNKLVINTSGKLPPTLVANCNPTSGKLPPNNTKYNKKENINIVNNIYIKEKYGEFQNIFLTENEYKKLIERFGKEQTDTAIDEMSVWLQANNKKYKDYYAGMINWLNNSSYRHTSNKTQKINQTWENPKVEDDISEEERQKLINEIQAMG